MPELILLILLAVVFVLFCENAVPAKPAPHKMNAGDFMLLNIEERCLTHVTQAYLAEDIDEAEYLAAREDISARITAITEGRA